MDALTPVEWTVVGAVIDEKAAELRSLIDAGTHVHTTGFLVNFTNAAIAALDAHREEENAAWDAHKAQAN